MKLNLDPALLAILAWCAFFVTLLIFHPAVALTIDAFALILLLQWNYEDSIMYPGDNHD